MTNLVQLAENKQFTELFIHRLGWEHPQGTQTVKHETPNGTLTVRQVASFHGLAVWVCHQVPSRSDQTTISNLLAKTSAERLLIFADNHNQDWRWPRHTKLGSVNAKLMAHRHVNGVPDPDLEARIQSMKIGMDEDPTVAELISRMREVFDQESETASSKVARMMGTLYTLLDDARCGSLAITKS